MRILHVINSLSGSGGAEQGLVREVMRFPGDVEQLVVTLYDAGPLATRLDNAGVEHLSLGLDSSRSGWNWPVGVRRLKRVIEEFGPDVVQSSLFSGNLVAQLATRGQSIPTLSTFTLSGDEALHRSLQPGADSWYAALLRGISARAGRSAHVWYRALTEDALATNCEALGVEPERGVVIPRGVPVEEFRLSSSTRSGLGLSEAGPLVLNVGRQTAQKGHSFLIQCFAEIRRRRGSGQLVILGREGDATAATLKAIDIEGIAEHVTIVPYTDRVTDYYGAADVFVFPALMEGLGTAVLEAMAGGAPVVAFDIPPVREVTGDGRFAVLVPVGDVDELVEATDSLLADAATASQRAAEAREWATRQFNLDGVAGRVYQRLVQLASADDRPR